MGCRVLTCTEHSGNLLLGPLYRIHEETSLVEASASPLIFLSMATPISGSFSSEHVSRVTGCSFGERRLRLGLTAKGLFTP